MNESVTSSLTWESPSRTEESGVGKMEDEDRDRLLERERHQIQQIRQLDLEELEVEEVDDHPSSESDDDGADGDDGEPDPT